MNRGTKMDFFIDITVAFLTETCITSTEPIDPIDHVASVFKVEVCEATIQQR
jgi:hypothetical protein